MSSKPLTREDLRNIARAFGVKRGQNTADTLRNLRRELTIEQKNSVGFGLTAADMVEVRREDLRKIAKEAGIPRGRDKKDTINNLTLAGHSVMRAPTTGGVCRDF